MGKLSKNDPGSTCNKGLSAEARKLGISRQAVWQRRKKRERLCVRCAEPALPGGILCADCCVNNRKKKRAKLGMQRWVPGGVGRPQRWNLSGDPLVGALILIMMLLSIVSAQAQDLPVRERHSPLRDLRDAVTFRDRQESTLALLQGVALAADGVATNANIKANGQEIDPLPRLLLGPHPTWARMAPLGVAQETIGIIVGSHMKRSKYAVVSRLWWLPQTLGITSNVVGAEYSFTHAAAPVSAAPVRSPGVTRSRPVALSLTRVW